MSEVSHDLARRVADAMYEKDAAAHHLGIVIEDVDRGYAKLSMIVRPEFLNGHAICHGGLMFTLCDTAFAYACNAGNHNTVASGCSIEFLKPVPVATKLIAIAQVQVQSGRHGVYDIRLEDEKGHVVALFRGKSAQIPGHVIPELAPNSAG